MHDENEFQSDEVRLANLERAGRRMEGPEGLDLDAAVHNAVVAYWEARDGLISQPDTTGQPAYDSALAAAPALYRKVASQLYGWREFWTDAGLAVIAGVIVVLTMLSWSDTQSLAESLAVGARSTASRALALVSIVGAGLCLWLFSNGYLRRSIGALAGGLGACVLVWQFGFASAISTTSTASLDALRARASAELQQASLNLMLRRQETGEFVPLKLMGDTFSLTTVSTSKARAVYHASYGVSGRIVADLGPSSGTLSWTDRNGQQVTNIFFGRIVNLSADTFSVDDGHGKVVPVRKGDTVLPPFNIGDHVVGAYDSKTQEAMAMITAVPSRRPDSN